MAHRLFLVSLALFASIQMDMYSAIKISINPKQFTGTEETTVKISCTLNKKEASAAEIVMIKIARKGDRAIVILDANNTISYVSANEDEVEATGMIQTGGNFMKSNLEMVIKEPVTEDGGLYICRVSYKSPSGTILENKKRAKLIVDDPEVQSLDKKVNELLDKVHMEQSEISEIGDKEKKDKTKVNNLEATAMKQETELKDLMDKENEVENKMAELEDKAEKQMKKLKELSNKEDIEVKSLKSTMKNLLDKVKKEENDIKEIEEKEANDKLKVTDLEEKAEEQIKEITDLTEKEKVVEKKVNEIEMTAKNQLKKMNELTKKGAIDKAKVVELEGKTQEQTQELVELTEKENRMETKLAELEEKVERALEKANSMKWTQGTIDGGATDTATSTSKGNTDTQMVAFSATIEHRYVATSRGMTVVFPDIIATVGTGYDAMTGVFTAPVDGLYHFSLMAKVNCISCYVRFQVLANLQIMFRLKVGVLYDQAQGSASSIAQLQKGDKVKTYVDFSSKGATLTPGRLCVFSGHRISA